MPLLTPEFAQTRPLQPLENGEHLDAGEFLCRYESMPEEVKAELVQGIVYMGSAIRAKQHGIPDAFIQGWLWFYSAYTPGVQSITNSTTCLSNDDVPQPDAILQILPEYGGQSHVDSDGYLIGPPELVVESRRVRPRSMRTKSGKATRRMECGSTFSGERSISKSTGGT